MIFSQTTAPRGKLLTEQEILKTLHQGLDGRFTRQRVLVLIPDHTRSLPLPFLFRAIVETLHDAKQLDFMVALGTHPPLSEESLNKLVGITAEERASLFVGGGFQTRPHRVKILNHAWGNPSMLASIGMMEQDEIKAIAGERWHPSLPERVDIRINRAALEYDHILILGPTFPHEVVGFSGGAKYLFPGISGPEMINATHWLGALVGVVGTIGLKETPVRAMIHAAARRLSTPVTLAALVMDGHDPSTGLRHRSPALPGTCARGKCAQVQACRPGLAARTGEHRRHAGATPAPNRRCGGRQAQPVSSGHGLAGIFIGDLFEAWSAAADLSAQRNVVWSDKPYRRVLSCAPAMYDELWTAAKVMYKLEPAVAVGGEVVIYAPHLAVVSHVHGKYIYEVGYHILPYFLSDWERFKHIPLGVLAHSTHLRGSGMMENGVEKPNVKVTLASKIPAEDCARLNLGYLDPAAVRPDEWQGREAEGILYVPRAGEMLYRVRNYYHM